MKIVDRLVLRDLAGPLLNSLLMFMMILFAAANLFSLTELLVRGVAPASVGMIALCSMPKLVTMSLPMAMLLGTLLAAGRLSGDSEHIALFAGGISFYRVMAPIIWVGVFVSIVAFFWEENIVPGTTREAIRLLREVSEDQITSGKPIKYEVMSKDRVDEFVNVYDGYDSKTKWFRKVFIVKMSDDPQYRGHAEFSVFAERARPLSDDPRGLDWQYENVRILDMRPIPDRKDWIETNLAVATTESLRRALHGKDVGMKQTFKGLVQPPTRDNRSMTFRQLRDKIRLERAAGDPSALEDEVDLWGKLSTPIASLIFGMVGAPLGIRPNRGSKGMGFGIAIGIIFLYWVSYNWLYHIGKNGGLHPLVASFAPNMIGVIAGIVLIARTRQ